MNNRIVILLVAVGLLAGCASNAPSKGTATLSAEEISAAKAKTNNDSISNDEFMSANLQSVPVPAIGTSKEAIVKRLTELGVTILKESDTELKVQGNRTRLLPGGVTLEVKTVSTFVYLFDGNQLISGPSIVDN